jgi:hypothetical protein
MSNALHEAWQQHMRVCVCVPVMAGDLAAAIECLDPHTVVVQCFLSGGQEERGCHVSEKSEMPAASARVVG